MTAQDRRTDRDDTPIGETDIANERMGNNQLQGNDQLQVRNQRHAAPDAKPDPEDLIESFENMDPKVRAERQNSRKG